MRKKDPPAETSPTPAPPAVPAVPATYEWVTWRKKDGTKTLAHAFRIVQGAKRPERTICHSIPGEGMEPVDAKGLSERCASCDDARKRVLGRPRFAAERPREDPRTIYEPLHKFGDWDR